MTDSAVVNHLARLKLKLLEKKLENEQETMEDPESPVPEARNYRGQDYALQSALRRRKDLLQQLREQNLLEEFSRLHDSPRIQRKHYRQEPEYYQAPAPSAAPVPPPPPPPPPPAPPRIIQQTLPQQPATIIQQIPQQSPLITQIPPPQAFPAPRSGSIKEGTRQHGDRFLPPLWYERRNPDRQLYIITTIHLQGCQLYPLSLAYPCGHR
ncbi:UNVERIFIED_CONTAM: hypothetical protein K2H54_042471 [Gekko kuhli]